MIPMPSGVRVWIATGHTDMRRGMQGLALQVQESLNRDPHAGASRLRIPAIVTTRSDGSRPPVPIDRGQSDGAVRCIF
jgi:transposase